MGFWIYFSEEATLKLTHKMGKPTIQKEVFKNSVAKSPVQSAEAILFVHSAHC